MPKAFTNIIKRFYVPLLVVIIIAAGWMRSDHLNWDEDTHLHPDERYMTMVAAAIQFPDPLTQYWDTVVSPLNPANRGQPDYVYGTLPLFMTRAVGDWLNSSCERYLAANPGSTLCQDNFYNGYGGIHLVGRSLSVIADLLTLLALTLLAYSLYGEITALLAAALYAFAVLPIQHAHFFVVDSFATVFVMWTLYFSVRAIQQTRSRYFVLAGLTTGMALASKVSVWPLAGIVMLAGCVRREDAAATDAAHYRFDPLNSTGILSVLAAGVIALITFRIAQPYAFLGPGFFGVQLNPLWLDRMRFIRNLMSGNVDMPPGHQWTQRAILWFPWRNMVFWGLGLPLGLAAWIGWGALGWQVMRRRLWLPGIPWLWGTLFFLYQATQWVKSMRYFLPVYPVFVLFAAWGLVRAARLPERFPRWRWLARRGATYILSALPWLALAGTCLWAAAFLQVYQRPVTRITASQWIFHAVPTFATLYTADGNTAQIPLISGEVLRTDTAPLLTGFTLPDSGSITHISLNKVSGLGLAGTRQLELTLSSDPNSWEALAESTVTVTLTDINPITVDFAFPPVAIPDGGVGYLRIDLLGGDPVSFGTSVIANEHWDDGLPLRLDGNDPFWNWYQGLQSSPDGQLDLYNEDNLDKRTQLLSWLDEADYIVLSSNRLYASIPRLPMRYPMTTAYYNALFDGTLGFELLADFVSFPSLGPCQFPDQEAPFAIPQARYSNALPCSIPYPPAEEAFSVYDHPRVLIFAKTAAYSRANAEALLPTSLLDNVQQFTPLQASRGGGRENTLMMDAQTRAVQESGGTWSELFDWQTVQNRYPLLAVGLWWLMLTLLGWLAFPWLSLAFPALRDRGYGLARIVGLLLWSYVSWLPAALHLLPHTRLLLWATLALLVAGSLWLARRQWDDLREFLRTRWRSLLRIEVLFAVLYFLWVLVRYLNPDLRHPYMGGEKPMDFAYLNAVIRSTWFPPYDPWFAGGTMNYYYYGFVMVGALIKALAIVPSIAYNLAVPSFFAMMGTGAYTVVSNLSGGDDARARRTGLWGVFLILILGNLGELQLLFKGFQEVGGVTFDSLIPGYPAVISALKGLWQVVVEGQKLAFRPEWWYWNATRVIPIADVTDPGAINEFPMFTFLYGDLHAHMMAFPLTQVALAIALQWGIGRQASARRSAGLTAWLEKLRLRRLESWLPAPLATFFLAALVAGALRATNTWDYPTYLALMSLGYLLCLAQPLWERSLAPEDAAPAHFTIPYQRLLTPVLIFVLAELLFRPFTANFATAYTHFGPWSGPKTPLGSFFIMYGQFLFPLAVLGVSQLIVLIRRLREDGDPATDLSLGIIALIAFIIILLLLRMGVKVAWAVIPMGTMAAFMALEPRSTPRTRLLWLWVGTALFLSLIVELLVLEGDVGRMNTVFKFYLQVWVLLGAAAAVAVERLIDFGFQTVVRPDTGDHSIHPLLTRLSNPAVDAILGLTVAILFATAFYPLLAVPAKLRDRWNPEAPYTLDGMAYMPYVVQYEQGRAIPLDADYRVIQWFLDHVQGSPVVMEMNATIEYVTWGNRVSIYTGLPGIVGWRWLQAQQRMLMPPGTVEERQYAVSDFYNTLDPNLAMDILREYGVSYVVLTDYERAYMSPQPLDSSDPNPQPSALAESKFSMMVYRGDLEEVYRDGNAVIYHVVNP